MKRVYFWLLFVYLMAFVASAYGGTNDAIALRAVGTFAAQQGLDRTFMALGMGRAGSIIASSLLAFGGSMVLQKIVLDRQVGQTEVRDSLIGVGAGMLFSIVIPIGGESHAAPKRMDDMPINITINNTNNMGGEK